MREQDVQEPEVTETRRESSNQSQPAKRVPQKRVMDTLSDENPLICRGMD